MTGVQTCALPISIIREYFNNPTATAEARRGGYFTLGDMGRFDDEGYLYIVDRKKDMIISGGENIFPNDIEEVHYRHAAVEMAAVNTVVHVSATKSSKHDRQYLGIVSWAVLIFHIDRARHNARRRAGIGSPRLPQSSRFQTKFG